MTDVSVRIPKPHAGQRHVLATMGQRTVLRMGRRWGKSVFLLYLSLTCAMEGGKVGWFSPNNRYATDAWRQLRNRLRAYAELDGGRISEQERRIELPNGGVCEIWSLHDSEDAGRGRDYDLVVVDEAGLIGKLGIIWESAIEPTLFDRKGRAVFAGTPKGARTPFNILFEEAKAGLDPEWMAFQGKTEDNDTIPDIKAQVEKARLRAERRGTLNLFYQEYYGEPADDGSNPIGLEAIKAATAKEPSTRPTVAYGVDLARSVDFTVVVGLDGYGRWTELHRWQGDWGTTKRKLLDIIGLDLPVVMDATGVGSPIVQDLQLAGMQVTPFVFSYRSRGQLIEDLITGVHGKRLTIPDGWLRAELETLGVEQTQIGPRYAVPDGMHDDGIMALAMAWRCYGYFAPTPAWTPNAEPTANRDLVQFHAVATDEGERDVEFGALGAGW